MSDDISGAKLGCGIVVGVIALFAIVVVFFASTSRIGPGEVGIVNNAGSIDTTQAPLKPGWHTIAPFVQGVDAITVVQQAHSFSEVQTAAQNQQTIYVDGTISYHVDSSKAAELDIQGGADQVIQRILWPAFQDFIKEEMPKYPDYQGVLNNRPTIRGDVKAALQGKTDQYGLFVDDVFLTNIHPEKSFSDSINSAAKAQQDLITAQNEAKAKVAAAQGDAQANAIRQQTITQQVLEQQALNNQANAIAKWDGKYPTTLVINGSNGNDPVSIILNGGSSLAK